MADAQAPKPVTPADQRGVPDAVQRVQAILNAENAPPPEETKSAEPQSNEPEQQAQPEPEAPAGPNKQVEGEEAAPTRETAEIPLEQLEAIELEVTTKGEDGKDVAAKLPIKELRLGYMRQADYQRKTAEVARQREDVANKTRQAIEAERTQMQKSIKELQALVMETVAPELNDTDMDRLATDDPFEYVKRRNRLDKINKSLSTIQAKEQELVSKQKEEAEKTRGEQIARARSTLEADIPGWNDTLYQKLIKSGEKYGYKPEEVATWLDPRAIKLLHAAERAESAAPVKPSTEKKVIAVPKVIKPGASADQTQAQARQQAAMKQLQSTGKLDDAAAVIKARFR